MKPNRINAEICECMKIMLSYFLFAVAVCVAASTDARAQSPSPCRRELTVAYYDAGAFYDPATGNGIDKDVIDEISKRTGCRFAAKFLSRGLIFLEFEQGKLDVVTSAIPTPEREKYGVALPFFWVRNELITQKDHDVHDSPQTFLADPAMRLGVINRYLYGAGWDEWIAELHKRGRVVVAGDTHQLMRLLAIGRIDAFPAVPLGSGADVKLYGKQPTLRRLPWFIDAPINPGGLLLSLTAIDAPTKDAIRQALQGMMDDGTLVAIFGRYLSDANAAKALLTPAH